MCHEASYLVAWAVERGSFNLHRKFPPPLLEKLFWGPSRPKTEGFPLEPCQSKHMTRESALRPFTANLCRGVKSAPKSVGGDWEAQKGEIREAPGLASVNDR